MYIIHAGKKTVKAIASGRRVAHHYVNRFRSTCFVNEVFRVCKIIRQPQCKTPAHFRATLVNHARRYDAIAGPPAAKLTVGEMVHVHSCVLFRGGEPVLVVCSL